MGICKDETYAIKLGPYMDYFENIFELLSKPLLTQNSNCWKAFSLQAIGDLIICQVPFLPLLMLILKAHLSLHIVVLKTCDHYWKHLLTLRFKTWALEISFQWGLQMWNYILCGWKGQKMRLWRMKNLQILNMFIFNGVCQWKRSKEWKKIVSKLLGEQMEIQFGRSNNGLTSHLFYFHFLLQVMSQSITL